MNLTGDRMRTKFARAQRKAQLRRGRRLAWWIRLWGGTVGARLRVEKGVHVRHLPHAGWQIGADVYLGRGVILDVGPDARFELADRVKLMHYTLVGVVESVTIDEYAQVGECSTIRDNDHDTTAGVLMSRAPVRSKPTRIGRDAWIARGVAVTAGADIGAGAVIGANAVVRGAIPDNVIAAGVPARVIRPR
jgi:acetyltransferase-like isoleucine patch superfamily enzyme